MKFENLKAIYAYQQSIKPVKTRLKSQVDWKSIYQDYHSVIQNNMLVV
jgi:hypothetical protein